MKLFLASSGMQSQESTEKYKMRPTKNLVLLCVFPAFFFLSSCLGNIHYQTQKNAHKKIHSGRNHFYLFANAGLGEIDIKKYCPEGISEINVHQDFLDSIAGIFFSSVYAAQSYEVLCAKKTFLKNKEEK